MHLRWTGGASLVFREPLLVLLILGLGLPLVVTCTSDSGPTTKDDAIRAVLASTGISLDALTQQPTRRLAQFWRASSLSEGEYWSVEQSGYVRCAARYGPDASGEFSRRWQVSRSDGKVFLVSSLIPCVNEYLAPIQ